jgi:hypothetical protein
MKPYSTILQSLPSILSVASICFIVAALFGRQIGQLMTKLIVIAFGNKLLPTKLRSFGVSSTSLRDPSKPSWAWISAWKNKWHRCTASDMHEDITEDQRKKANPMIPLMDMVIGEAKTKKP